MDKQGPVVDWLKGLLDGLREMLTSLLAAIHAAAQRAEVRIEGMESNLEWLPWKIVGVLVVLVIIHAWITKPRTP